MGLIITGLLLCLLVACGDRQEFRLVQQLPEGLKSLGHETPEQALVVHNALYDQAMALEKSSGAQKLNLDRTIGMLALRRAMLAEVTGKEDLVQRYLVEAFDRFDRGGVLPKKLPQEKQDQIFAKMVSIVLEIEHPSWAAALHRSWRQKGIIKSQP